MGMNFILLKLEFFFRFTTLIFPFYKILFMNRLKFSYFVDFFGKDFKSREEYGFSLKSASKRDCE
jgi:hypothetical protein